MIEARRTMDPQAAADASRYGRTLEEALRRSLRDTDDPIVVAVSGGRDSMALLHAFARWARARVAAVATFDHGTGRYATDAAALVLAEARRLGFHVQSERVENLTRSEAAWRTARWQFLRGVAHAHAARVATAHTSDDQVETIVMRLLRGAGARGLAALAAPSAVLRPWLTVSRHDVAAWVDDERIPAYDDPSNIDNRYLRTRVRCELLPALELARPGFAASMLQIGERAAHWRREVDRHLTACGVAQVGKHTLRVPIDVLQSTTASGAAVLWPALFARVGITLDARGTEALVRFSSNDRRGARLELAGGAVALRCGVGNDEWFELRDRTPSHAQGEWQGLWDSVPDRIGGWRWRKLSRAPEIDDPACFALSAETEIQVRGWMAGDRIRTVGAEAGRRVARYFSDLHVPALDRQGWPVVLLANVVVWIPGICRGIAAPHWPGRPDLIWYRCEREHGFSNRAAQRDHC